MNEGYRALRKSAIKAANEPPRKVRRSQASVIRDAERVVATADKMEAQFNFLMEALGDIAATSNDPASRGIARGALAAVQNGQKVKR